MRLPPVVMRSTLRRRVLGGQAGPGERTGRSVFDGGMLRIRARGEVMSHILYRESLNRELPVAVAGDGPYLIDAQGKRYIDGSGGAAVSCLGHSNEAVRAAIREQSDRLAFAHSRFFTTEVAER